MVYSSGMICAPSPSAAAVSPVIGPMQAMVTPAINGASSPGPNSAAKFLAVDELVNVTTSTPRLRSPSRRVAAASVAGRVR